MYAGTGAVRVQFFESAPQLLKTNQKPVKQPIEVPKLNAGDTVTWSSQSRGTRCIKTGSVIAIVPPDEYPDATKYGRVLLQNPKSRDHESYIVMVKIGKRKPKFFWPRAFTLQPVSADAVHTLGVEDSEPGSGDQGAAPEEPEPVEEPALACEQPIA